jgi:serine acetyltransferase
LAVDGDGVVIGVDADVVGYVTIGKVEIVVAVAVDNQTWRGEVLRST